MPESTQAGSNGGGRKPAPETAIDLTDNDRRALELRAARMKFHEIAAALGYADASGAYRAVQRGLRATMQEPADELRRIECEALDQLYRVAVKKALGGSMWAIDRCLNIMDRRARLLGLDAPQRRIIDVVTPEAFDELRGQMQAELADLIALVEGDGGSAAA